MKTSQETKPQDAKNKIAEKSNKKEPLKSQSKKKLVEEEEEEEEDEVDSDYDEEDEDEEENSKKSLKKQVNKAVATKKSEKSQKTEVAKKERNKVEAKTNNKKLQKVQEEDDEEEISSKSKAKDKSIKLKEESTKRNVKKHQDDDEDDDDDDDDEEEEKEQKCSKISKKGCPANNKNSKTEEKIKEKNNQKAKSEEKEKIEEKNKKDEKKSKQNTKHSKGDSALDDSKVTELTKQQLANFKGVWGLIKTIFTISSTEEIGEEIDVEEGKKSDSMDIKSINLVKEEKHKGKRKLLSLEMSFENSDESVACDSDQAPGRKEDIEFTFVTNEHHNEEDSLHFQKRKLLSIDSKAQDKKVSKGVKKVQQKATEPKILKKNDDSALNKETKKKEETVKNEVKAAIGIQKPKVGWEYRYRIYRYAKETGNPVPSLEDYELAKIREKEEREIEEKKAEEEEEEFPKPSVGWAYRYRISKWKEANPEKANELKQQAIKNTKLDEKIGKVKKEIEKTKKKNAKDDDECDGNPNSFVFGRFRLDKTKIGKVGWEYRYRISKKLNQLLENADGKTVDKGTEKLIPIEIVDYLDDPEIPYCDQVLENTKSGSSIVGKKKIVEDDDEDEDEDELVEKKPKVGWEYRYRISKMMEAKGLKVEQNPVVNKKTKEKSKDILKKKGTSKNDDDDEEEEDKMFSPELKPKVGWEYRYRIQRKIEAESKDPSLAGKIVPENYKKAIEKAKKEKEEKIVPVGENLNTHNIGWEYRYRLHRKLEALKAQDDNSVQTKKSNKIETDKQETRHLKKESASDTTSKKEIKKDEPIKKPETVKKEPLSASPKTKEAPIKKEAKKDDIQRQKEDKKKVEIQSPAKKATEENWRQLFQNYIAKFLPYSPKFIINVLCLHTDNFDVCDVKEPEPEIPKVQQQQKQQQQEQQKSTESPKAEKKSQVQPKQPELKKKPIIKAPPVKTKVTAKAKPDDEPKVIFATEYKKITKNEHRIEKVPNKKDLKELEHQAYLLQMVIEKSRQIGQEKKEESISPPPPPPPLPQKMNSTKSAKNFQKAKEIKTEDPAKSIKPSHPVPEKIDEKIESSKPIKQKEEIKKKDATNEAKPAVVIGKLNEKVNNESPKPDSIKEKEEKEIEIEIANIEAIKEKQNEIINTIEEDTKNEEDKGDDATVKDEKDEITIKEKDQNTDDDTDEATVEENDSNKNDENDDDDDDDATVEDDKEESNVEDNDKNHDDDEDVNDDDDDDETTTDATEIDNEKEEEEKISETESKKDDEENETKNKIEVKNLEIKAEKKEKKKEPFNLINSIKAIFSKASFLFDIESFELEDEEEDKNDENDIDVELDDDNDDDEEENDENDSSDNKLNEKEIENNNSEVSNDH